MDLILANLADSVTENIGDVACDDTDDADDLADGEISDVMKVLECVTDPQVPDNNVNVNIKPATPTISIDTRIEKTMEKQAYLESRFKNLQMRINRLRAQKLSCNARDVMCSVVTSMDRRQRIKPVLSDTSADSEAKSEQSEAVANKITKAEADEALGQIHNQLRHVQKFVDPDATDSSSGGESADEMDKFTPGAELYAPLEERAKFRWLSRRAQLASQWVWLQAQVSDLEYKIRQHTDLYRSQRLSKGSVQLGEDTVSWPAHAKVPVLPGGDQVPLSCPVPTKVYGGHGTVTSEQADASSDDEATMTCCRTRPVKRVRRRKLVDTYGLHHHVSRAAKLSSVTCQCIRPHQWCVLCLGRKNHSVSVSSSLDKRGRRRENVALLDHSYHTVLSDVKTDTDLGLVLMESLANKRYLVRQTPSAGALHLGSMTHLSKVMNINDKEKKENSIKDESELGLKRKYMKKKDKNGKIIKKRRKYNSERESRPGSPSELSGHVVSVKDATGTGVEKIRDRFASDQKKKRKSSYDIDHIVIPMSMAATTRIDKIKYKEILTPSWRRVQEKKEKAAGDEVKEVKKEEVKVEEEAKIAKEEEEDNEFEDISDLAYKLRHVKAEEEERIRWATPLGRVHGGQRGHNGSDGTRRRARRLDSCRTEASSGANTPGPLSPEAIEDIVVSTRPGSPQHDTAETPDIGHMASPSDKCDTPVTPVTPGPMPTPVSVRTRRRTSSVNKSRDRNLSEASQESSR